MSSNKKNQSLINQETPTAPDIKMQQTYVSPSDGIMSPATAKLAAFKNKRMSKGLKPQTLFAKTSTNQASNVGQAPPKKGLFANVERK